MGRLRGGGAGFFLLPLKAETQFPKITPAEVAASLEANKAAWAGKIDEVGRPCLLLTRAGLEAAKARLLAEPRSAEAKALFEQAAKIARHYPKPYEQHEGNYESSGELWIRVVGDDLVALSIACVLQPNEAWEKTLHDGIIQACKYPAWGTRGGATRAEYGPCVCPHRPRGRAGLGLASQSMDRRGPRFDSQNHRRARRAAPGGLCMARVLGPPGMPITTITSIAPYWRGAGWRFTTTCRMRRCARRGPARF